MRCRACVGGAGVAQAWTEGQRIERYMASNDPDFEKKAADLIGLYTGRERGRVGNSTRLACSTMPSTNRTSILSRTGGSAACWRSSEHLADG
jgi:hypothetical protein